MVRQLKTVEQIQEKGYRIKTVAFSLFSMLAGFVFTLYNGILGIVYRSLWNGSICVYYLLLSGIRAIIVCSELREATGHGAQETVHGRKFYFVTYAVLILMNISLFVPAAVMVTGGRSYTHGLIPAIAMAAYTTYRITVSTIHYKRSSKSSNVLESELRTINMIDSLVAVLTLQNAMIAANGGMNVRIQTLAAFTSAAVLALIIIITVRSILKASSANS